MSVKPRLDFDEARTRKQLDRASKRLYANAEGVLLDNQERLHDRIVALAPDDTGLLKSNVFVVVIPRPNGPVLQAGVRETPYAVFNEFGTVYMQKKPFLRPALAEMPGYIRPRRRR